MTHPEKTVLSSSSEADSKARSDQVAPRAGDCLADLQSRLDRRSTLALVQALGRLVEHGWRERIDRLIGPDLRPRIGASDVVAQVCLSLVTRDASEDRQAASSQLPPRAVLWLRVRWAWQKLWRDHHPQKRTPNLEANSEPGTSSACTPAALLEDPGPSPSGEAIRRETADRVRQALARLPEIDQQVLTMRYLEGLSNAEAADSLGLSPSALSNRQNRALRHLGAILGDPHPSDGD